jgi:transcriptional regulator with XRE-family HTH domain
MIVKRLRKKNGWSQDQLATLSGLSLRTIQRVESGHSGSMETINSLSSVFETDITMLTGEIEVIDKSTEAWKEVPLWVRAGIWGIRKRNTVLRWEIGCVLVGLIGIIGFKFNPAFGPIIISWAAAYWYAISIRWIDNNKLWL